ncbi:bile acid:sodium symporter family protein [Corynebacterium doosanense]|uniref:Na+-dependent transporter n=1 Tax=Corynebacterium doosanense CAU 212 = DSM 45436 TaxID=558173 RepID=A0A097IHL0_9CORY|nr:bile acid:sodium symporter family protein [Corynebacterium doosanense]AIT61610.1 Na+-dependent transporter [Corynebacterium doosanense CAU 212 = DSM 45436]
MSSENPSAGSALLSVLAFPAFILIGAAIAFFFPAPFVPMSQYITYFLMVIMFAMGLTLTLPDFQDVARRPWPVLLGVILQFTIMPLGAVFVARVLGLNEALAVGLLMLGSVPGGTSSNVITFLARGDVALSVTMTSVSTVLSPIVTPMLMLALAGAQTDVNAGAMAWSLLQTVLLPVIGGLLIRTFFDRGVEKVSAILPAVSILGIGGVVFPAVAVNNAALTAVGPVVFVAVILHNVLGYALGYGVGRLLRQPERSNRTIAVEVGTQSAGLASGMSGRFFSPEAALPGAVAAVVHNITGAIYAAVMRRIPLPEPVDRDPGTPTEVTAV